MRQYLHAITFGVSLTAIGVGGYLLYAQNQQLEARVSVLEKKVEELVMPLGKTEVTLPSEQDKKTEKSNIYQRLQSLDNKVGEWIKKH